MSWVAGVLDSLGVTGREPGTFPDGAAFRVEIPSVEGPRVLAAVLRAAEAEGITVNRVSQGSGAVLLRRAELRDMAQAGVAAGTEVCLFDVLRATEEGIRSFLVADLGLLAALKLAQARGALPDNLVWKASAAMSPSNPVTVKILADLGASTVNIPADVTLAELAEMRAAVGVPLDLYVESPDALGGVVRGQELGDLIGAGAPLYAKFGLRNAAAVYPSGHHLDAVASANAVEKVRRAAVALEWLDRLSPGFAQSKPGAACWWPGRRCCAARWPTTG